LPRRKFWPYWGELHSLTVASVLRSQPQQAVTQDEPGRDWRARLVGERRGGCLIAVLAVGVVQHVTLLPAGDGQLLVPRRLEHQLLFKHVLHLQIDRGQMQLRTRPEVDGVVKAFPPSARAQGPPSEARKIPVDILVHQRLLPQISTEDYFCKYQKTFELSKLTGPDSSCELATENAYISCSSDRGCVFGTWRQQALRQF